MCHDAGALAELPSEGGRPMKTSAVLGFLVDPSLSTLLDGVRANSGACSISVWAFLWLATFPGCCFLQFFSGLSLLGTSGLGGLSWPNLPPSLDSRILLVSLF